MFIYSFLELYTALDTSKKIRPNPKSLLKSRSPTKAFSRNRRLRHSYKVRSCHVVLLYSVTCFLSLGVQNGNFHIVGDLIGHLFRSSTRGATPHNNVFLDAIYSFIGWVRTVLYSAYIRCLNCTQIGLAVWRRSVDGIIVKHRSEHEKYLTSKSFHHASTYKVAK